jgi:hypothetical protein
VQQGRIIGSMSQSNKRAPLWSRQTIAIALALLVLGWGADRMLGLGDSPARYTKPTRSDRVVLTPDGTPDPTRSTELPLDQGPTIAMPGTGSQLTEYGAKIDAEGPHEIVINEQFALREIDWATAGQVWGPMLTSADATLDITDPETGTQHSRLVVIEFSDLRDCGSEAGAYRRLKVFSAERVDGFVRYAQPYGVPIINAPNQDPDCWQGDVPTIELHPTLEQP